jgi:hypothetical protein
LHDPGQIGLPPVQDAQNSADFLSSGLAALGIEADEVDLAVMAALHGFIWSPLLELLSLDAEGVEPERCPNLSRAPE